MTKIGILALQGAVREHARAVEASGATAVEVKRVEQLSEIDGLILPGGESTAMRRLMDRSDFIPALQAFGRSGKPIFGTCAGLILLAKEIEGADHAHLALMDMKVARNAFGRQVDSFETRLDVKDVAGDLNAVFIRAPYVVSVGPDVQVLAEHEGRIVAARQENYLCAAFHPELTDDHRFAAYFVKMVEEAQKVAL
ncbi:pyridoxal 5'-phosphate synthase glutaminase subunit PdxT [Aciduricibacillus chroicocephali]|uniref:Pyridoxal 5'-phosphate synthase subunit PdxT n=1 Tax=Aciduricibacillus chroicocephali TaxID=3054939 RepID=A0ABY9KVA7_9BACI|nr:pyridoxal 5'-phosphate synthase glutaminase subunit PdxT [Bacillaceae bacterium 44XB]